MPKNHNELTQTSLGLTGFAQVLDGSPVLRGTDKGRNGSGIK